MSFPERFGPYVLLKSLGSGAAGEVFLARPDAGDRGLPPALVIKRLRPHLVEEERFLRRFRHEAQIATMVDTPHVAKVYDAGRIGDSLYIAMELISGWTVARVLKNLIDTGRQATIVSVVAVIEDALLGLAALHEAKDANGRPLGIVHRDITPKNVIIGDDGRTRLIDLGIGRSELRDWKTSTGVILGTPGYLAPEQALAGEVDHRADLYSLCVVAFELLTLQHYIPRGQGYETLRNSATPVFRRPSSIRPEISPALDEVLERGLAIACESRFATARDFLAELRRAAPNPEREREHSTMIDDVLAGEHEAEKTELAGVVSAEITAPPGDARKWIVYAHRPEIRFDSGTAYKPLFDSQPDTPAPRPVPGAPEQDPRADTQPAYGGARPFDPRAKTPRARRSGATPLFAGIALLIPAVLLAAVWLTREPEPIVVPPAPIVRSDPAPPVIAQPIERPETPELEPAPAEEKRSRPSKTKLIKTPARLDPRDSLDPPDPPDPPPSAKPTALSLIERARALRKRHASGAIAGELDELIFQLAYLRAGDTARAEQIARRLDAIDQTP